MSDVRQRTESVRVRLTPQELSEVQEKASIAALPLATYFRETALGHTIKEHVPELKKGLSDLGKLGGSLRQSLGRVSSGELPPELKGEIRSALDAIRALGISLEIQAKK